MNELIHNVESVFSSGKGNVLTDNFQKYYIPLYQRGYKWTKNQIEKLLTDINNFEIQPGKFYCVQNITLVPNLARNCYNVVDGQQRLTTMTLLLAALESYDLVKNKLIFPDNSIRKYTNIFIQDYIVNNKELEETWDSFISIDPNFDHQDIFHLYDGFQVIKNWIDEYISDRDAFRKKLLNDVKFICNIIEGEKEEKIFGNLNSKRIYLDGADLVRAIIITRVTKESAKDETIKNVVRINERRVRIGWELDSINQWWNQPEVKDYFKPFIQLDTVGDIHFDLEQYPINQLISLYASSKQWTALSLEEIELLENTSVFYNELQSLHFTLVDWYQHKEIYHYLGFLFHQSNSENSFYDILEYWKTKCSTKLEFSQYLLAQIKDEIFGEEDLDIVFKSEQNWYSDNRLVPILLLLDIIEALKENRNRLHVNAFLKKENDIEHIYPQNPKSEKDKKGYVKYLIQAKPEMLSDDRISNKNIDHLSEESLNEIIDVFSDKVKINSIGNLVLLYYRLNRSLQNKSYAYKRKRVLDHYNEGNYIQPHTLKVFSRYFQDGDTVNNDSMFWTQTDVEENETTIKRTIQKFFTENNI